MLSAETAYSMVSVHSDAAPSFQYVFGLHRLSYGKAVVCLSVCVSCVHILQTSSPLEPLDRLKSNFMWSLHGMGEQKFAYGVQVT